MQWVSNVGGVQTVMRDNDHWVVNNVEAWVSLNEWAVLFQSLCWAAMRSFKIILQTVQTFTDGQCEQVLWSFQFSDTSFIYKKTCLFLMYLCSSVWDSEQNKGKGIFDFILSSWFLCDSPVLFKQAFTDVFQANICNTNFLKLFYLAATSFTFI